MMLLKQQKMNNTTALYLRYVILLIGIWTYDLIGTIKYPHYISPVLSVIHMNTSTAEVVLS